ncbi:iron ABC transporter permease [Pelomonas sp. CA6]|uniref:iron chelate uptake ABC transporter family permease subunit n=1 Tax=Pelomonas sp. CA6 TaxID=2907999 RepID=UPI001F4A6B48|nr:iron chelate uptake ABC transporter family permease subunit [Pelomonas sp. CA6]MCH7341884.1 iron ABC transporter permease [Pelomonas sp. CA6]
MDASWKRSRWLPDTYFHVRGSPRLAPRRWGANLALALLVLLLLAVSLMAGELRLSVPQLWQAWRGEDEAARFLLAEIRLPRALAALLVGFALGVAGLLMQLLARNRLASPDVIGVHDGAVLAMALSLWASGDPLLGPWWQALLGALLALGLVLLASGGVGRQGQRALVVGLAVAALARAGFELVLSTVELMHGSAIYSFSMGSLLASSYELLAPVSLALLVLLALLLPLLPGLELLALGETQAQLLGLRVAPRRLALLCLAAALAGLGVSVAGPVGFVALVAPLLARRWLGALPLLGAGLAGAALTLAADLGGRVLLAPHELPAGVLAGMLGGPLLLWLVLHAHEEEER